MDPEAEKILNKNCVPIRITYRDQNEIKIFDKQVFPNVKPEVKIATFLYLLKMRIAREEKIAMTAMSGLFCFIKNSNTLVMASQEFQDLYNKHKSPNGFLDLEICKENVFGTKKYNPKDEMLADFILINNYRQLIDKCNLWIKKLKDEQIYHLYEEYLVHLYMKTYNRLPAETEEHVNAIINQFFI